jgi:acyl-CoA synthetase (AMP-forming)/AMP-acid ligase II
MIDRLYPRAPTADRISFSFEKEAAVEQLSTVAPGDWISIGAHRRPSSRCVVGADGEVVDFAAMDRRVNRLAAELERAGIGHGDRIAVLDTDSVDYLTVMFASFKLGAVLVPINFRLAEGEIAALFRTVRPALLFAGRRYAGHLDAARDAGVRLVVGIGDCPGADRDIAEWTTGPGPEASFTSRTADTDILCLVMTSGTTGRPKTAMHSQRMLKANTVKGVVEQGFRLDDLVYAGPPLFHVAGLGYNCYSLSRGGAVLMLSQFDAPELLGWMQHGGVTRLMLVPSMLNALLAQPGVRESDYRSVRSIAYGGSPMPPSMLAEIHDVFGCDLYNTFGAATEGGGQTVLRPEDHVRAFAGETHLLRSIGTAQYGIDLKLCDPSGAEVATGEVGEIWTRSDSVMSGYLDDPELTATVITPDGWFHGGDLARRDEEGFLYLVGRADDMIIRGGENIYPVEIEAVIRHHPAVSDAFVLGIADPHWGQRVAAAIVLRDGERVTADELRTHCRASLAGYKVPDRWLLFDDLPRNSTGKTDNRALRAAVEDGRYDELSWPAVEAAP